MAPFFDRQSFYRPSLVSDVSTGHSGPSIFRHSSLRNHERRLKSRQAPRVQLQRTQIIARIAAADVEWRREQP